MAGEIGIEKKLSPRAAQSGMSHPRSRRAWHGLDFAQRNTPAGVTKTIQPALYENFLPVDHERCRQRYFALKCAESAAKLRLRPAVCVLFGIFSPDASNRIGRRHQVANGKCPPRTRHIRTNPHEA
jgi:hypothetical protein